MLGSRQTRRSDSMQFQAEEWVVLEELPELPVVVALEAAVSERGE